ncbi:hypothetical protein IV203_007147 [Nitzschia inconspicua]|uniref:Uncharacterized protein n=1 Tax=Nitzschia inconspicua TaxID=303405 RepID=A0A9K3PCM7_9STRA|nr:hypothetical protein IV203_007147 [Nitzschia inconspicua]
MKSAPISVTSIIRIAALSLILFAVFATNAFQYVVTISNRQPQRCFPRCATLMSQRNNDNESSSSSSSKPKTFLDDLKGMIQNFDDVVDDFVYKRMGAGEQWYGKRKYNPSGRVDGDYNGMGRSDYFRIEIARVQKEEMELRKQRRLEEEEEARKRGK